MGVIRVKPGTDFALKQGIEKSVPGIKVLTYKELQTRALAFQDTNPGSTIFNFGAMMGFIVGVAIVYQVLYSDVSDHRSEYATLKAIGYSNRSLLLVIFQEAILLAVLGYIPGFIATLGMYELFTTLTKLELIMTLSLALNVFVLTLAMCLISAAIASNKLRAADPAKLHPYLKNRQQCAINALTAVGLADRTRYYPDNLSDGQKQRVARGRALVSQPQLVLADEPTAALDSKSGREVVTLMQKLAKEQHCTILMVTHDNRILDVADRIIHMEDGCLVGNLG